jgi:hypothetical protein
MAADANLSLKSMTANQLLASARSHHFNAA